LVVDNAEHFRLYLLDLLTEAGHYVVTARGGQEAFGLAQEWMPDLVVTDLLLPGSDGMTLCQRIKGHPRLARIPVVLVTGLKDDEYRRQADAAGVDLFVAKPIQADQFLEHIHALIARTPR
jgi:CheY-like chemotaxis protein